MFTSQQRDEDLVAGMEAGADDYITKPFKNNELKVRLYAGTRIIELQNDRILAEEALRNRRDKQQYDSGYRHNQRCRQRCPRICIGSSG
jgi:DNA-binding response OmpR family regulator